MAQTAKKPWLLIIALLLSSGAGLWAAFALAMDKILVLTDPAAELGCNFSVLVQCGANLQSWQGSVFFGVPNPFWGLIGWTATLVVAMALLAGARFAAWFWLLFHLGHAFALGFSIWLISQSVYVLGTLCPWCMVTWAAVILAWWTITFHNLREGHLGAWGRRIGRAAYSWAPLVTLLSYIVIAVVAQLRLDYLAML